MDPIIQSLRQRFSFRSHMLEPTQATNPNIVKLAKVKSKITSLAPNFPPNIYHSSINNRSHKSKHLQNENSPMIRITPSSLQKIEKKCVTVSRNQCYEEIICPEPQRKAKFLKNQDKGTANGGNGGNGNGGNGNGKEEEGKIDTGREEEKKKVYKTAMLRSRISTNFDIDLQVRRNNRRIKKCCCGDCEECLKDFSYFLHLVPSDKSLPEISAKSWSVWRYDLQTGKFFHYHGKNIHKPRHIASLTKMITAMTAFDFLKANNYEPDKVLYEIKKSSILIGGTSANLQIGQVYTITELMYAMMLPSGNDASLAVAQAIGSLSLLKSKNKQVDPYTPTWCSQNSLSQNFQRQSLSTFISQMQQKCIKLGLHSTSIFNPHGNDAFSIPNTSTSNQVCRLSSEYLQKYPILKSISSSKIYSIQRYNKKWENTNKLLEDGFEGIKTGINQVSGPCLAACYRDFIVVVLASRSLGDRWLQVKKLVRWMLMKAG